MRRFAKFAIAVSVGLLPKLAMATCNPFPSIDQASSVTNFASITNGSSQCVAATYLVDSTGATLWPVSAALADAMANPTTTLIGSMNMLWNGTTWDRWDGVNAGTGKIDLTSIGATATLTGGVNGSLGVGGLAASGATAAGNPLLGGGVFNTTQPTVTNGQAVSLQMTARGGQIVSNGVEPFTVQPGNTANTTPWLQQLAAAATGGSTPYGFISTASTNSQSIKGSAGTLYFLSAINTSTTIGYLRIYNLATAPTCSSATGFLHSYPVPPASASGGAGGFAIPISSIGEAYTTGIGYCITGGGSSTDNTSSPAGIYLNGGFK